MIVEKLRTIRSKLEKREALWRTQTESEHLEQMRVRLRDLRRDVKRIASEAQALDGVLSKDAKLQVAIDAEKMLIDVRRIRDGFDAGKSRALTLRELNHIGEVNGWELKISEDWKKYFEQQVESSNALVQLLFPYMAQEAQSQLIRLQRQLEVFRNLPRNSSDVEAFQQSLLSYKAEIDTIATEFPVSVQRFLQKLNDGKASLLDVTPDILVWCQNKGLAERLWLRLAINR